MPKIDPSKVKAVDLYGVSEVDPNLTLGERLRQRFRPHDTVQVMNIDNEPLEWQCISEDAETYYMDEDIKIIERENPDLWRLEAGERDILEGYCAYIMIDALYKKMTVKKVGVTEHPLDEGQIKLFNFDNPEAQEEFIEMVFQGKVSPQAMQRAVIDQIDTRNAKAAPDRPIGAAKPRVASPKPLKTHEDAESVGIPVAAEKEEDGANVSAIPVP